MKRIIKHLSLLTAPTRSNIHWIFAAPKGRRLFIILFFLLPFGKAGMGYAQTWVTIPDANFAHYLDSIIPAAMNGNQMDITNTLVTTTTHTIDVSNRSIANLFGIQYFTSLTQLICISDSLTSLPAFPSSLTYLYCEDNSLSTLPALSNTLQLLYCDHNNISCFPTFPNSITTINISSNPYNCLPNYIAAMSAADLAMPLCAAGNSNGCPVATGIQQVAGINEQVTVYPNPASTHLTLTLSKGEGTYSIAIYNTISERVHHQIITSSNSHN
ncbi:MAG: hypothetical protein ACYDCN_12880 [Bacteroidia bacterium]